MSTVSLAVFLLSAFELFEMCSTMHGAIHIQTYNEHYFESFHVNSTTDFGSCSQIYLPLPIFVGHDVLCTFTKYCILNDVCLQNMAL